MKPKMLYLMHIDWNWIKQRPQYIEEEMERFCDVTIFCPRNYRLKEYSDKENIKVFYTIPFIRRYPRLAGIDELRIKLSVERIIKKIQPDYIYITAPSFSDCIPEWYDGCVVYDCMDNMIAFEKKQALVDKVAAQEYKMTTRADIVLTSSEKLRQTLIERYDKLNNDNVYLVRNGYNGKLEQNCSEQGKKQVYTLCYFGTISHWFNFDFILRSLEDVKDIEYLLIGPVESGTVIPKHERIKHLPPVKHDELYRATQSANAFLMPFEVNELILSVDPVKLYEYINFNKNILCVYYPEIERFSPFVHFYTDYETYTNQIRQMMNDNSVKYSDVDRRLFLEKNDWRERGNCIKAILEKKIASKPKGNQK